MAKKMKLEIPEELDIVEVKCSGMVDIIDIVESFERGADGVMIIACHEGNCFYLSGNMRAKMRVSSAKKLLEEVGIEGERLQIFNLASNMGFGFNKVVNDMKNTILKVGRSPLNES